MFDVQALVRKRLATPHGNVWICSPFCVRWLKQSPLVVSVLGSATTGLIFTQSQEGTQPGGLTLPGQSEQGIPYRVLSCWVLIGGSRAVRRHSQLGSAWRRWAVRVALCVLLFVLCILLICIIIFTVPFVCCSVKLPLSRPTSFCLFSFYSPPHPSGQRGGRVALLLPATAKL